MNINGGSNPREENSAIYWMSRDVISTNGMHAFWDEELQQKLSLGPRWNEAGSHPSVFWLFSLGEREGIWVVNSPDTTVSKYSLIWSNSAKVSWLNKSQKYVD